MINPPTPLPGTHLAEVDCIDCGTVVLAVPQHADTARCAACGREHHGATVFDQNGAGRTVGNG